MFFANQEDILARIKEVVSGSSNNFAIIKGRSGSGKSYLLHKMVESFCNDKLNCVYFSGDTFCIERDYYYFYDGINKAFIQNKNKASKNLLGKSLKKNMIQASKLVPVAGNVISSILEDILGARKSQKVLLNSIFSPQELEILFQLEYLCNRNEKTLFLLDDLHLADPKSLQFLYLLLAQIATLEDLLPKMFIVATTSLFSDENGERLDQLAHLANGTTFHLDYVNQSDYNAALTALGLKRKLSDEMYQTLYSITDGHLQLIIDVVNMCNDNEEANQASYWETHNWSSAIKSRIYLLEHDGELVSEALKYASLFGNSFLYYELELALGKSEGEIRSIINSAQSLNLVRQHIKIGARFNHDVIRKSFRAEITEKNSIYFSNYAKCLKVIHPGYYAERSESLYIAGEHASAIDLWVLFVIQQIRMQSTTFNRQNPIQEYLPDAYVEFLLLMAKGYEQLFSEEYQKAQETVNSIEDLLPICLRAEKCYLYSLICSKWLNEELRHESEESLYLLLSDPAIIQEPELWERLASAALIASIHNNEVQKAKEIEKKLYLNLSRRIVFDFSAEKTLNILRRKSSCLHSPIFAVQNVKKSVDYFGPPISGLEGQAPLNHVEYYMSLCNYIATTLMAGLFDESCKNAKALLTYIHVDRHLQFSRIEMPLNNCVLALYLAQETNEEKAIAELANIKATIHAEVTTSIVLNVNHAIMLAYNGEIGTSKSMLALERERLIEFKNVEFYYCYLVDTNLAVLEYLIGDQQRAIEMNEELIEHTHQSEEPYFSKRNIALQQAFSHTSPADKASWLRNRLITEGKDSCWNYYGRKLLFGELEFWSES